MLINILRWPARLGSTRDCFPCPGIYRDLQLVNSMDDTTKAPISCTKRGYNLSTTFSFNSNSRARSNGIHTPFKYAGPSLMTWRVFSALSITSLQPRFIPATLSSFVPLIIWLFSRRAMHMPSVTTWKQRLSSSSHIVVVTPGVAPGGATWHAPARQNTREEAVRGVDDSGI
jgi:hypothetical protein